MTLKQVLFEGADATSLTVANSGAVTISAPGGSIIYDSASKVNGSTGLRASSAVNAQAVGRWSSQAASLQMAATVQLRLNATPSHTNLQFWTWRHASGAALRFGFDVAGHLLLFNAANAVVWTSSAVLAVGTWYRIAAVVTVGTGTTNGVAAVNLYTGTTGSLVESFSSSALNLGTAAITAFDLGIVSQHAGTNTISFDDLQANDGAAAEIPPISSAVAVSATAAYTVDATAQVAARASQSVTAGVTVGPSGTAAGSTAIAVSSGHTIGPAAITTPAATAGVNAAVAVGPVAISSSPRVGVSAAASVTVSPTAVVGRTIIAVAAYTVDAGATAAPSARVSGTAVVSVSADAATTALVTVSAAAAASVEPTVAVSATAIANVVAGLTVAAFVTLIRARRDITVRATGPLQRSMSATIRPQRGTATPHGHPFTASNPWS